MKTSKLINKIINTLHYHLIIKEREQKLKQKIFNERVNIGRYTYGHNIDNFLFWNYGCNKIIIGKYCSIGERVTFFSGGEHNYKIVSTFPFSKIWKLDFDGADSLSKGDIEIGNDVWIGRESVILSGVKIGNGVVIGTRTVVSKDIPDYAIVVGNPMRIIKYRFEPEQINELLKIKWWDWSEDMIIENIQIFYDNIEKFIFKFKKQ